MAKCPKQSNVVDLVESLFFIRKLKKIVVRVRIIVLNILNSVDGVVTFCLYSGTNMVILTCSGGFRSRDLRFYFCKKSSPIFPDADWAHARLLIE